MVALPRQLAPPAPDPGAGDLRARVLREAIRNYEALLDLHEEATAALEDDPALDHWCSWLIDLRGDAERSLLGTILATDPAIAADKLYEALYEFQAPRGVAFGGKVYLAVCDPDLAPLDDPEGNQVVRLVVLARDAIAALGDDATDRLLDPRDGAEGDRSC